MKKILILGGGITGLSTAWKLIQKSKEYDVTIIEKEGEIGGLAKTVKFNNNYVDIGPHSFFSEDKEIYNAVTNLFQNDPKQIPKVKRSVKMFFMNYYVDYPLSAKSIFFQMGPIIPIKCFLSFIKSYVKNIFIKKKSNEKQTIKSWAINNFGYFLYKNFFKPYTEQFWKIETEKLSHRVIPSSKKLDFAKTLKHLFINKYLEISKREPGSLNLVQRESLPTFYPKKGFGQIAEKISDKIKKNNVKLKLNEEVQNIKHNDEKKFEVSTNIAKYDADIVVSSLPLNYSVKILQPYNNDVNLLSASKKLNYLGLIMVYLIVKRKGVLNCQYCYFVGKPYNRVSNLNLFSDELTNNKDTSAISLEISCHVNDDMWLKNDDEILSLCLNNLQKDKILTSEEVSDTKILKVPNVYPIYKSDYDENLKIVETEIKKIKNFYSVGRLGQFYYGDIDQMIRIGFDTADKIIEKFKRP